MTILILFFLVALVGIGRGLFVYETASKQALENLQTSGSANTELDQMFIKPGASRPVSAVAMRIQGKGAGLTALSGLSIRMKRWSTTSSTSVAGTSTTPTPKNALVPACVATAGCASSAASTVTSGTGGPLVVNFAGMGASGPGGWVSINPDDTALLDGGATMSLDLFSASGQASLNYEAAVDTTEG